MGRRVPLRPTTSSAANLYFFDADIRPGSEDLELNISTASGVQDFSFAGPTLLGSGNLPLLGTFDLTGPGVPYTLTVALDGAATPEPSTLALLATGVVGVLGGVRRARRITSHPSQNRDGWGTRCEDKAVS